MGTSEEHTFGYRGNNVFYRSVELAGGGAALLLHGYSFNSDVWEQVRTIETFSEAGYSAYAMDVPGFPNSRSRFSLGVDGMEQLIKEFAAKVMRKDRFLLMGSSASGYYALKFAESNSGMLDGLIAVAPVNMAKVVPEKISARCLFIWGTGDNVSDPYAERAYAERIANSEFGLMKGAGHACYLDNPAEFNGMVSAFLKR